MASLLLERTRAEQHTGQLAGALWSLALSYFVLHSYFEFLPRSLYGYTIHVNFYIKRQRIHLGNGSKGREIASPFFVHPKVHSVTFRVKPARASSIILEFGCHTRQQLSTTYYLDRLQQRQVLQIILVMVAVALSSMT